MDLLTDVLRALRLRGTVYFQADFRAPWGMDIKGGVFANFHLVVQGECWVRSGDDLDALRIGAGELVVFPHGDRHALLDRVDGEPVPAEELLSSGVTTDDATVYGGDGPATTLICGHFECDRDGGHPLLSSLPRMIHVSTDDEGTGDWLETAAALAAKESQSKRSGSSAVVDRLAEVLLIQVLRHHAERSGVDRGFLAATRDRALSEAIALVHTDPAHAWSVEELARRSGMSRSTFAAHFKETIGTTPMRYLTQWRMQKARELLFDTDRSIGDVAEVVGYESEWAFAKAFKREFGTGPGAARRQARASA